MQEQAAFLKETARVTMPSRSFRFSRILRLKTQLRKVAQDEIASIRQDIANAEKEMEDVEVARNRNQETAMRTALAGTNARDLQLHAAYDRGQQACGQALRKRVDALGEVVEAERLVLLQRRREERQFESLQARQGERERAVQVRSEANLQDDLARRGRPRPQATEGGSRSSAVRESEQPAGLRGRRGSTERLTKERAS